MAPPVHFLRNYYREAYELVRAAAGTDPVVIMPDGGHPTVLRRFMAQSRYVNVWLDCHLDRTSLKLDVTGPAGVRNLVAKTRGRIADAKRCGMPVMVGTWSASLPMPDSAMTPEGRIALERIYTSEQLGAYEKLPAWFFQTWKTSGLLVSWDARLALATFERGNALVTMPGEGILSVVGTPIGNLSDASPRVLDVLARADVILCEDTRVTGKLLSAFGIHVSMQRCDENVMAERIAPTLTRIAAGERVAFVSDAGMPGVSDPGQRLVDAALDAGLPVEVVPGPSAVTCAVAASGIACEHFFFEGFLPRRRAAQLERLRELTGIPGALVVYESPRRVSATLAVVARNAAGKLETREPKLTSHLGGLLEANARLTGHLVIFHRHAYEVVSESHDHTTTPLVGDEQVGTIAEHKVGNPGVRALTQDIPNLLGIIWDDIYIGGATDSKGGVLTHGLINEDVLLAYDAPESPGKGI